jgi:aspartate/methionine/tyrosine aminotransferase
MTSQTDAKRPPTVSNTLFSDRVRKIDTENAFKIGPCIREVELAGNKVIKCNLGEPDFPLPAHIRDEVKRALDADMTHYTDPQGIEPLREAIARDVSAKRGIEMGADRVVVFPGAKPPIGLCQEVYCNPGDEVIYPSPGFPIYESFTRYVGATPVPLHLSEEKGFSFSAADLEPLVSERTKIIILNFPSNPTGGVATRGQLEEIAALIERKAPADVRIYSDEVYENIVFDGLKHESIASIDGMASKTIIVSGVSKTYSWTGGRIGWAAFPTVEEAQIFKNMNINYFSCVPPFTQMGAKLAIESPESPPVIAKMGAAFQERRDVVVDGLNAIDGISCQKPSGAFYVFPNIGGVCETLGIVDAWMSMPDDIRPRTTPSTLFQLFLLYRYHVATMDRKSFGRIGSEGRHFLRLSIATGLEDLKEAVERIARAAGDKAGFRDWFATGKTFY